MESGVSPFHQPGAGRLTSTVIWPGLAGVRGNCPLVPVTLQLPIMFICAAAGRATMKLARARAATRASRPRGAAAPGRLLITGRASSVGFDGIPDRRAQPRRLLLDASFEAGSRSKDKGCREEFGTKAGGRRPGRIGRQQSREGKHGVDTIVSVGRRDGDGVKPSSDP